MNPNIIITPNEIRLKRFFYTVTIPKNSDITYSFYDQRKKLGLPLELTMESDSIKVESRFGVIGKIIYTSDPYIVKFLQGFKGFQISHRKSIRTINAIKIFLETLKSNGYNVAGIVDEFNRLIGLQIPEQFTITTGTPQQKIKFLKYSSIGMLCFALFIVLLSAVTNTPLSEFVIILSLFVTIFVVGFIYNSLSYLYWLFKNRDN